MAKAKTSERTLIQVKLPERQLTQLDRLVGYMDQEYRSQTIIRMITRHYRLTKATERTGTKLIARAPDGTEKELILI